MCSGDHKEAMPLRVSQSREEKDEAILKVQTIMAETSRRQELETDVHIPPTIRKQNRECLLSACFLYSDSAGYQPGNCHPQ